MYKSTLEKDPNTRQIILESMHIGKFTVHRTINEYKATKW